MSSIAVFLVLGGATAFAASKIGSNEIKANSITTGKIKKEAVTTAKIKKDAVTGAKVKESTLGEVPSATNATNATNAGNANTVGGMTVSKISYTANTGSGPQQILNIQGLILTAECSGSNPKGSPPRMCLLGSVSSSIQMRLLAPVPTPTNLMMAIQKIFLYRRSDRDL